MAFPLVTFGYLYWRRGLESAMIAHFCADFVLYAVGPCLLESVTEWRSGARTTQANRRLDSLQYIISLKQMARTLPSL
jgi:hypothetical protein